LTVDVARDVAVAALAVSVMLSVGFGLRVSDLRGVLARPKTLGGALGYEHVLLPLAAFGIVRLFEAPPAGALAVVLCAVTPGGPVGPALVQAARGDVALAVGLVVIMAVVNVFWTPLSLEWLGVAGAIRPDFAGELIRTIALFQLVPLAGAMFVRARAPLWADRLGVVAQRATQVMIAGITIGMVAMRWRLMLELAPSTLLSIAVTAIVAVAGGYALAIGGPEQRRALGLTSGVRNVGLALLVANAFGDEVLLGVMIYGLVMLVVSGVVAVGLSRMVRAAPVPEALGRE
jgi:BASS family bile acid:Na+ symporter